MSQYQSWDEAKAAVATMPKLAVFAVVGCHEQADPARPLAVFTYRGAGRVSQDVEFAPGRVASFNHSWA